MSLSAAGTTATAKPTFPMERVKGKALAATSPDSYFAFLRAALKGCKERLTFTVTAEGAEYTAKIEITKAAITDATGLIFTFEGRTGSRRLVRGTCAYDQQTLALKAASLTFLR